MSPYLADHPEDPNQRKQPRRPGGDMGQSWGSPPESSHLAPMDEPQPQADAPSGQAWGSNPFAFAGDQYNAPQGVPRVAQAGPGQPTPPSVNGLEPQPHAAANNQAQAALQNPMLPPQPHASSGFASPFGAGAPQGRQPQQIQQKSRRYYYGE